MNGTGLKSVHASGQGVELVIQRPEFLIQLFPEFVLQPQERHFNVSF